MLRNSGCLEASFQVSEPNPKLTSEDSSSRRIVYKYNTERAAHCNQKFSTKGPYIKDVRTGRGELGSPKADILREVAWI